MMLHVINLFQCVLYLTAVRMKDIFLTQAILSTLCRLQHAFLVFHIVQAASDALPFRSAFKHVIFRQSWDLNDATVGVNHINFEPESKSFQIKFLISYWYF